ncbi:MAG TPA: translation elongation factor-like protein [Candidatus Nanoarchaeia archaeon]|nr:translation elongation factor-like protein [Candidatus Nanoarchaeia archaeon]
MPEKLIGEVMDYYAKVGVIALKLKDSLKVGDKIRIKGGSRNFEQKVDSMQIQHKKVTSAAKGSDVGIKVSDLCRKGDSVFRI